jgi:hypothetical protein
MRHIAPTLLAALALAACAAEPVSVVLTPTTPEIADLLTAADLRWEAAGVAPERIIIGEGGAPVRFVPGRPASETRVIGRGHDFAGVRWMELGWLSVENATHEMGHALGIGRPELDVDHIEGPECGDVPDRPTMCPAAGAVITARDLELACSVGRCTGFEPEVD